jgi:micrococcal nuclease
LTINRILSIAFVSLILLVSPCRANEPIRSFEGLVIKVIDGDTIKVRDSLGTKVKVRLYGIDAPETEKIDKKKSLIIRQAQPYGEEAYRMLWGKIENKRVRLDVMDIDRHGRAVSIVWLGDRNINREMVSEGWAWVYMRHRDNPQPPDYIEAEEKARREHRGLWQLSNPQPPWEFRKLQRRCFMPLVDSPSGH